MEPRRELAQGDLAVAHSESVFAPVRRGIPHPCREILIISAALSLAGAFVYIALLLWAAREDGRDQQRREWLRGR